MSIPHEHADPTLAELSEGEVLARIFPLLPRTDAELLGPGDDCAVVAAPDGRFVVTTDMMVHGPDFRFAWSTPEELGWKAAASNLADVAAMGARPTALVVAIAAPSSTPVSVLERFSEGLRSGCAAMAPGCGSVGGDLSASATFTIAVTAFGDLEGRAPVTRSGARPGDTVALAGRLGDAARGLALLFAEGVDDAGEPSTARAADLRRRQPELVRAQLAPEPPISLGVVAARAGATAMMDVSDGLAIDAGRMARASGVGIDLERSALGDDVELALRGGEDHGLLACFPGGTELPNGFRPLGRVTTDAGILSVDGEPHAHTGWDPYRNWDGHTG